jgi:hypothetical protein
MFDTELAGSLSHLATLPMLGWASVDRAAKLSCRHLSANDQQAADLALNAANPRPIGPNNNSLASIRGLGCRFSFS